MSVFSAKTGRYNRRNESSLSVFNPKNRDFCPPRIIPPSEYLLLSRFFPQISGVRTAFCVGIEFDADLTLMKFTVFSPFVTRRRINKITRIQMARRFVFFIHTTSSRPWQVYTEIADSVSWLDGLDWYGVECQSWFSVILDHVHLLQNKSLLGDNKIKSKVVLLPRSAPSSSSHREEIRQHLLAPFDLCKKGYNSNGYATTFLTMLSHTETNYTLEYNYYINVKQTGGNRRVIVTRCHIHKLSDENLVSLVTHTTDSPNI